MSHSPYIRGPAPGQRHTHTVILLHGRDSDAVEFANEFFESEASPSDTTQQGHGQGRTLPARFPNTRWVFPMAPVLRSKRFQADMSQWFDMWSVEDPEEKSEVQLDGLDVSIRTILAVIRAEEEILPRDKIFLGGISQGFATVLATLFTEGRGGFAGLLGLCSWMPFVSGVEAALLAHGDSGGHDRSEVILFTALQDLYNGGAEGDGVRTRPLPVQIKAVPVFIGHASDDAVVPVENGRRMKQSISNIGLEVDWHEYADGGHWVNEPQGVDDMVSFIDRCMSITEQGLIA